MKEFLKLRINRDYANLLFKAEEGKNLGTSVKIVELSKEDLRYNQVPIIAEQVKKKFNKEFFFGWEIKREYSKKELNTTKLLQLNIKKVFEPSGEECGTLYDETAACEICGANRKQISSLTLKKGTIPQMDIAKTLGGEVVVSEKFVNSAKKRKLRGLQFSPTNIENYYQLTTNEEVELSHSTVAGINPFDLSTSNEGEIYQCPKMHTIGLNLLSVAYVLNSPTISESDFSMSKQKIGIKRGLLRPEPIYFCSQAFKEMVEDEKLNGFIFEITNIE